MPAAHVRLDSGYCTTVTSRHHVYHVDEPVADGGTDTMVSPTEMLMGALGSCMAITCKMYADRKGMKLDAVEIDLDFKRFSGLDYANYTGDAQFVHEVRETFTFHGDLTDDERAKLLEIASKCPVSRVLEFPTFFRRELAGQTSQE
jgi:putative redox protein